MSAPLGQWQPIETAPMDGTQVDLWTPACGGERVSDCRFNTQKQRWEFWGQGDFDNMAWVKFEFAVSHWMPIPTAPESQP